MVVELPVGCGGVGADAMMLTPVPGWVLTEGWPPVGPAPVVELESGYGTDEGVGFKVGTVPVKNVVAAVWVLELDQGIVLLGRG